MNPALAMAREYGVSIECVDLGDWGVDELRSEYDSVGPKIRVNIRIIESLPLDEVGEFITLAVGHELYHHREHRGEIQTLADRKAREAAANAFAQELLAHVSVASA